MSLIPFLGYMRAKESFETFFRATAAIWGETSHANLSKGEIPNIWKIRGGL